ncbi:hypothetical protein OG455_17070 [Kitasatospora sp. NBC_01287]|uniref:hypothetical protein n=1 Tax=Kitasatospora sp. NBC_01287 TaxID=2903573 RepID=UPI002259940C|nr:hypothetical protein [Kitasatospora sp. NBC_01287]MCX4747210.1 hypothetical protein [Kitasatospora sp. NBC_01287]
MAVFLLGCVVMGLIGQARGARRTARRALESAERAERLAADAVSALAELRAAERSAAVREAVREAVPVDRVVLTKAPAPGREQLMAVLHTELVQVLGRRAADELRALPVAAPVDAVPADAVPAVAVPVDAVPVDAVPVVAVPADAVPRPAPPAEGDLPRLVPVTGPRDSVGGLPEARPGERFHYSGVRTGEGEEEFPIDWPEPGAVAIAEVVVEAEFMVTVVPMTRTRTRVHTHPRVAAAWGYEGQIRARGLLTQEMTHLKVESREGASSWSVWLRGPSELDELLDERQGSGSPILAVRPRGPVEVVAHAKSRSWSLRFVCGCWAGDKCACTTRGLGYTTNYVSACGEAIEVLTVPRPGLLVVTMDEETDPWRLRVRAVGSERDED